MKALFGDKTSKTPIAEQKKSDKKKLDPLDQISQWISDSTVQTAIVGAQKACVFVESEHEIGSGVCLSPGGLILTAGHCLGEDCVDTDVGTTVRTIEFLDKRCFKGVCVARSATFDLALLQLDGAMLASTPVKRGDRVIVVGQPGPPQKSKRQPKQRQGLTVGNVLRYRCQNPLCGQLEMVRFRVLLRSVLVIFQPDFVCVSGLFNAQLWHQCWLQWRAASERER